MVGVDLGGRSASPDCSAISVIDCHDRICETVAQWRGHIDHDLLIEKAIAIASFYNQALLVVESNTLETHASDGKSAYLLRRLKDEYSNVFRRKTEPHGFKVGFQTNVLTTVSSPHLTLPTNREVSISVARGSLNKHK